MISNLLECLENLEQQRIHLLMLVISVLDVLNKYWMDVRDLAAKRLVAQIDTGVEMRVELVNSCQETLDVKH